MNDSEDLKIARLLQASATLYARTHNVPDAVRVALELEEEIKERLKETQECQTQES